MADIKDLPISTRVMAPLGDVLHRGIVVEPLEDHPKGDEMICIEFTPPVTIEPSGSIDYITCPAGYVTLGWFRSQCLSPRRPTLPLPELRMITSFIIRKICGREGA
jgi:hypothetical protein